MTSEQSSIVIRRICSFAVTHPLWLPSECWETFPRILTAEDYPFLRFLQHPAPRLLAKTGFHYGLRSTLKLLSCPDALSATFQFHPKSTIIALLAFRSFRVIAGHPGFPAPFEVSTSIGFFCNQFPFFWILNGTLMEFALFDLNFLFNSRGCRGYWFPLGVERMSPPFHSPALATQP